VRGCPGGFLRSLRNYSRTAGKYLPESRLLQTACLLLYALSGSWLLGFDGLRAATQCSAHSGNHRVTLIRYFFIPLLVPPYGGMDVYLKKKQFIKLLLVLGRSGVFFFRFAILLPKSGVSTNKKLPSPDQGTRVFSRYHPSWLQQKAGSPLKAR